MKIPLIELCPTDPLKYFSYSKVDRIKSGEAECVHPMDRLFVNDPIRHNVRQSFRVAIPIMQPDDRIAARDVMSALTRMYKLTENHLRMIDYAHTVRLYDEMHMYVLRTEKTVGADERH